MTAFFANNHLDLRGTPCPINYVRCSLAIEELEPNDSIKIDLDRGEPEEMILPALKDAGHKIDIVEIHSDWMSFLVTCVAR